MSNSAYDKNRLNDLKTYIREITYMFHVKLLIVKFFIQYLHGFWKVCAVFFLSFD